MLVPYFRTFQKELGEAAQLEGCSSLQSSPEEALLDTAWNLCGFCDGKTNLEYFENTVKGYYEIYSGGKGKALAETASGALCLEIISFMSDQINRYTETGKSVCLERAYRFLERIHELKRYGRDFCRIMERYAGE